MTAETPPGVTGSQRGHSNSSHNLPSQLTLGSCVGHDGERRHTLGGSWRGHSSRNGRQLSWLCRQLIIAHPQTTFNYTGIQTVVRAADIHSCITDCTGKEQHQATVETEHPEIQSCWVQYHSCTYVPLTHNLQKAGNMLLSGHGLCIKENPSFERCLALRVPLTEQKVTVAFLFLHILDH